MGEVGRTLGELSLPLRFAIVGAVVFGLLGGVVGLSVGLRAYAPTAWAAVFEIGLPATVVGAAVGAVVGALVHGVRRAHRH